MYTGDDSLEVDNVSLSGNVGANRAWVMSILGHFVSIYLCGTSEYNLFFSGCNFCLILFTTTDDKKTTSISNISDQMTYVQDMNIFKQYLAFCR